MTPRYHPFYCEENIWWLCADPTLAAPIAQVVFVANQAGAVPMAAQRAGGEQGIVWWDYHCIARDTTGRIWDLDSTLALPTPGEDWLATTFPRVTELPESVRPRFRLVPADQYRRDFATDRHHMRTEDGGWLHAPPPWPCIGDGSNLARYRDVADTDGPGQLHDLEGFRRFLQTAAD